MQQMRRRSLSAVEGWPELVISVSTHMRGSASCSPGTMHLSTYVSALLTVWHVLLLPDFKPKQFYY